VAPSGYQQCLRSIACLRVSLRDHPEPLAPDPKRGERLRGS
jgi:hypothetical protein